jgi:hypothetical protein
LALAAVSIALSTLGVFVASGSAAHVLYTVVAILGLVVLGVVAAAWLDQRRAPRRSAASDQHAVTDPTTDLPAVPIPSLITVAPRASSAATSDPTSPAAGRVTPDAVADAAFQPTTAAEDAAHDAPPAASPAMLVMQARALAALLGDDCSPQTVGAMMLAARSESELQVLAALLTELDSTAPQLPQHA